MYKIEIGYYLLGGRPVVYCISPNSCDRNNSRNICFHMCSFLLIGIPVYIIY